MIRKVMTLAATACALSVATAAAAAPVVYSGSQQLGTLLATYSITTDGTTGNGLDAFSHITAYSVTLAEGGDVFTYGRTTAGGTGSVSGNYNASTSGLSQGIFSALNLYTNATTVAGGYVAQLNFNTTTTNVQLADAAHPTTYIAIVSEANRTTAFASAAAAAPVPEAATWATMIVGMGAIGVALRRRRVRTTVRFA